MRWIAPLFICLSLLASPALAVKVKVKIDGISGDLKENVELSLSIYAKRKKDQDPGEIVRLHERAENEILVALQPFGYYRPTIIATLDESQTRWVARYEIDVGPPLLLSEADVRVRGLGGNDPAFDRVIDRIGLKPGDQLSHPAYERMKAGFVAVSADSGYLTASFDSAAIWIDEYKYTSGIVLHFNTGPRFVFGDVTFDQDVVDERTIRGYVRFEKGSPFRARRLLELQSRLTDSGYFSVVEVVPRVDLAEDNMVPIHVTLLPQKRQRYDIGVGFGTDTGPRVTLDIAFRRLNKKGHRGEVRAKVSMIENSALARYVIPPVFPKTWVTTFSIGIQQLDPTSSESDKFIVGTTIAHERWLLMESFGLNYAVEKYVVGVDTGTSYLLQPGASWSFAQTADPIFTTRGFRSHLDIYGAHDGALSNATFLRAKWQNKLIRGLTKRTRFVTRTDLGWIWTSQFRDLPPTVRFFAGGDMSVRGYEFESLGPKDELGNVIGGPVLGVFSVEFDHYFLKKWGAAVFFDAGNAFTTDFDEPIQKGTGVGARWISPVGLFRVDFAWALDDDNAFRVHFVIGPDL